MANATANIGVEVTSANPQTGQVTAKLSELGPPRFLNGRSDLVFRGHVTDIDVIFTVTDLTGLDIRFDKNNERNAIWIAKGQQCPTQAGSPGNNQFRVKVDTDPTQVRRLIVSNVNTQFEDYTYRLNFKGQGTGPTTFDHYWLDPRIINGGVRPPAPPRTPDYKWVAIGIAVLAIVALAALAVRNFELF